MAVHNAEIAHLFERYAVLLEMDDANPFRVRAYRNAARTIENLPRDLAEMVAEGADPDDLPGVGEDLAAKIAEILKSGTFKDLKALEKRIPGALADLTELPGLGPKRVKTLYDKLKIKSVEDLFAAAKAGKLKGLEGFGAKTEAGILKAAERKVAVSGRIKLSIAEQIAAPLVRHLELGKGVKKVIVAGSFRRRRETVGDLDILVTCKDSAPLMQRFTTYEEVGEIVSKGTTRSTVRLKSGLQIDLRVVPEVSYGAALHYFTGSKAHNIAVRTMGVKRGLKINEYGVFRRGKRIAGRTEEEVYKTVGLPYIEPELRENTGEIDAARKNALPKIVKLADIKGDLHTHTSASDGHSFIAEMAEAAQALGYQYLAISDHVSHMGVVNGLDAKRLARQMKEIDKLNAKLNDLTLLKSAEVDILPDGKLDLDDGTLAELDFVIGAVHSEFDLTEKEQTERILRAMDNPYMSILAHPTGRLIGEREAYSVDMKRIMQGALERGCALEINSQPARLDLSDVHCRMAKEMGVKLVLSTDAHSPDTLGFMRYGIDQARRGWLEPSDILNTRGLAALRKALARSRTKRGAA